MTTDRSTLPSPDEVERARSLRRMVSGQSRWIGREDIHAYAFGSRDDSGRFDAARLVFKVIVGDQYATDDAFVAAFDGMAWVSAEAAAEIIGQALAGEEPAAAAA